MTNDDERGSGTMLVSSALIGLLMLAMVCVWIIGWLASLNRGQVVADLAAVAGAQAMSVGGEPCGEARRIANLHGGRVVSCHGTGDLRHFDVAIEVAVPLLPRVAGAPSEIRARANAGSVD